MMDRIQPHHWRNYQHYKDRSPPWIKLNKSLLDDYEFQCLPVASRALAPCLWLLASEDSEGWIDLNYDKLSFRLRMSIPDLKAAIKPLIDNGFFTLEHDASGALAPCYRDAMLEERRGEAEAEAEKDLAPSELVAAAGDDAPAKQESPKVSKPDAYAEASADLVGKPTTSSDIDDAFYNWNVFAEGLGLPKAVSLTAERRRKIAVRLREVGPEGWIEALEMLEKSPFCRGENKTGWRADLDFLLQAKSFHRLREGGYTNGGGT